MSAGSTGVGWQRLTLVTLITAQYTISVVDYLMGLRTDRLLWLLSWDVFDSDLSVDGEVGDGLQSGVRCRLVVEEGVVVHVGRDDCAWCWWVQIDGHYCWWYSDIIYSDFGRNPTIRYHHVRFIHFLKFYQLHLPTTHPLPEYYLLRARVVDANTGLTHNHHNVPAMSHQASLAHIHRQVGAMDWAS